MRAHHGGVRLQQDSRPEFSSRVDRGTVTESRLLLQHFLAALAYRTQKALRGAPGDFADFRAGTHVRTPHELVWHMTGVIGYARTMLNGGSFAPPRLRTLGEEVVRFHATLEALREDFANPELHAQITDQQFLQGPLSDAMTHAGQLAMLRRQGASRLVFAAPVGPADSVQRLREMADDVVVPWVPHPFGAVSRFYGRFEQTSDAEVRRLLAT